MAKLAKWIACEGIVNSALAAGGDGIWDGAFKGIVDGALEGDCEGIVDGTLAGGGEGILDGNCEGIVDGTLAWILYDDGEGVCNELNSSIVPIPLCHFVAPFCCFATT